MMRKSGSVSAELWRRAVVALSSRTRSPGGKTQRPRQLTRIGLARLVVIPLVGLLLCTGCVHWVPLEPDFANGETRQYDKVRIDGEGGTEVEDAYISWPVLAAIKEGKPLTIDLRRKSVEQERTDAGKTTAVVLGSVLGGAVVVAGLTGLLFLLFNNVSFGYYGG